MNAVATAAPGSPVYAAPEARYPEQHSPKMDTFSYGVLLVEMCIRRFPESESSTERGSDPANPVGSHGVPGEEVY